jgi:hypothetical protein
MALHRFELSKSVSDYSPNEEGCAATTEVQSEGPLVSPKLPQQAGQGLPNSKANRLVVWASSCHPAWKKEGEQCKVRPEVHLRGFTLSHSPAAQSFPLCVSLALPQDSSLPTRD